MAERVGLTTRRPPVARGSQELAPERGPANGADFALFVIWSKGRHAEARVLADLEERFTLLKLYEVAWSPGRVMENYRRFYSDLPVRGVYHSHGKGLGPFVAAVVMDPEPEVSERMTSRGPRTLNARFLDAKLQYRRWAGELTIHSTETPFETERDLTMLFGLEPGRLARLAAKPRPGEMEHVARDLTGAGGWTSEAELFQVLGRAVTYVATGVPDIPPGEGVLHSPHLQLLTDDYLTLHAALGAHPRLPWPHGGGFRVRVAGEWLPVRIRFVGDGFYDSAWASRLLTERTSAGDGTCRLPPREDFTTLAYDILVHGGDGPGLRERLAELASRLGVDDWPGEASGAGEEPIATLSRWLRERKATVVGPSDPSVGFDPSVAASAGAAPRVAPRGFPRRAKWWGYRVWHGFRQILSFGRDQVLFRAPWVRRMRRLGPGTVVRSARRGLASGNLFAVKRAVLLLRGVLFLGWKYRCPCCGWHLRGFAGQWGMLASNPDGYCPRCNAKARHRRLWLYLEEHTDLLERPGRVLEIAPWWALSRRLRKRGNLSFIGLDLAARGPHVSVVGDAARIPLDDDCIDSALCIHTLEHIEHDQRAMSELFRVLKPGGWAVVSVPLKLDRPTHEDPTITDPGQREREFGERSHVRFYGLDIQDRLKDAGFTVLVDWAREIPHEVRTRFGLRDDENLFLCRKAAAST